MTFKAIIKRIIEIEANQWVTYLLDKSEIKYLWTTTGEVKTEIDRDQIYWDMEVVITLEDYSEVRVVAGGTADDHFGLSLSVIEDDDHSIIWMNCKQTREVLGITEFKIGGKRDE